MLIRSRHERLFFSKSKTNTDKLPILFSPLQRLLLNLLCILFVVSLRHPLSFYCPLFGLLLRLFFILLLRFLEGGGSSESFCLVHPPYALMCLLLWFYCILCDIIDFTVFHLTVLSVLCPVFFFSASIVYPSTANYVF